MLHDISVTNSLKKFCIIITTSDDQIIAEKIAEQLVEIDLASCVQIDNVKSIFKWEGVISSNKEFRLMIKAKSEHYTQIQDLIVAIHNYEVPEIIKLDIADGLASYLNWLDMKK